MGVDIGFKDADAIAILAYSDDCPTTYLVEELITTKQGITELVDQMNNMHKKYDIIKVVMDEGGLGKKVAEEIRRRHGINVDPADKARKQENVELLNDSLRLGKFKAHKNTRFVQDSYLVQIDWDKTTPNRVVIKKNPHSDIIDSVLYAFKESYGFAHVKKPKGPVYGSKEWADAQSSEMFERELPFLKKKESSASGLLVKTRTPDEKPESDDQDDPSAAHEACGQAMLNAIKSNDAAGLASAIKDLMELSESPEAAPHSYEAQNIEAAE